MLFFTSDTHFGSRRTLELSHRPFLSTTQMDVALTKHWNSRVTPKDVVIHLGDFGDPCILSSLNFEKLYLIPGNYERKDPSIIEAMKQDPRVEVWEPGEDMSLYGKSYCLVHEPLSGFGPDKFYLFGHIHKLQMVKRNGINVSTDIHNFRPVTEEEIAVLRKCVEEHYDDNVFTERCE